MTPRTPHHAPTSTPSPRRSGPAIEVPCGRAAPRRDAGSTSVTSTTSPTGCLPPCPRCTRSTSRSGRSTTPAGLVAWLGISRQALFDRVRRGTVLACRTADGHLVYPSLQFGRNGAVRPGRPGRRRCLRRRGVDGWSIGAWLTTPSRGVRRPQRRRLPRRAPLVARPRCARVAAAAVADASPVGRMTARERTALGPPPASLTGFPAYPVDAGTDLFRAHGARPGAVVVRQRRRRDGSTSAHRAAPATSPSTR